MRSDLASKDWAMSVRHVPCECPECSDLRAENERLRAEVERLSQRRYELLHEVAELRRGTA